MKTARVVYDTMVFLQAAINPHRRYATMEAVEDRRLILCTSQTLIAEVRDVLTRPALAAKFPALTPKRIAQFLVNLKAMATAFDPVPDIFTWPEHPDDDHLFNLAICANANYLVTWETRILNFLDGQLPAAKILQEHAPNLSMITPVHLADVLRP